MTIRYKLTAWLLVQVFTPLTEAMQAFGRWLRSTLCSCCGHKKNVSREVETEPLLHSPPRP